ncbi:MAG: sodium:proton antiporter [Tepidisphaeraceae bacterium]
MANHRLVHFGHPDHHIPGYELPEGASPTAKPVTLGIAFVAALVLAWVGHGLHHWSHGVGNPEVNALWMTPFALLLASIAIMPFVAKHFWEHYFGHIAVGLGLIVSAYYFIGVEHGTRSVAASVSEYISFIFLLGSLFVVSGGILIRVRARATPFANVIVLLLGAVLANVFGTTGASMLLIRPFLRMNRGHLRPYHVVFFIFVVSNAGGSLTPIGDPPLFLGYLMGVPFWWVLEHCWPIWALVCCGLLLIFFAIDKRHARTDDRAHYDGDDLGPTISLYGGVNLLLIGLILAGILLHENLNHWAESTVGFELPWRESMMAVAAFGSLWLTPRRIHGENRFNYAPIKEVALIFVGIFLTMLPALNYLYNASARSGGLLKTPGQYYFSVGSLSSVLDNAPTYKTFLEAQLGTLDPTVVEHVVAEARKTPTAAPATLTPEQLKQAGEARLALEKYHARQLEEGTVNAEQAEIAVLVGDATLGRFLVAISMGAVLFGAMTYIGNGPNFMVKSIAEHAGAPTPSFFGYVFRFAVPILLPLLVLTWAIFLR